MMSHQPLGADYPAKWPKDLPYKMVHQGISAEMMVEKWGLIRDELDDYSYNSHLRAMRAIQNGFFHDQIVPVKREDGLVISNDEGVRMPPDLEKMARKLGIQGYINFTGFIPYETVPTYVARAHVAVAPMIDDVGAPNKIFEYLALGKATVASSLPGVKAVFDDSSVLYFQPGDKIDLANRILELYKSPEKRADLSHSGKTKYNQYRWPIMRDSYLRVYEQLLG